MLDDYKNSQEIAYSLLVNTIKKNKLSHAYLFETNNNSNYISQRDNIRYSFKN